MPVGTPGAVKVGPGLLYVAPIGTAEPTSPTAVLPSAWHAIGYTEAGHTFTTETTSEPVEVAEELDPIRYVNTKRTSSLELEMAELNATNWSIAHNGGTIGTPAGGYVTFEPPALGDEQRLMLFWASDDGESALLARQVLSTGAIGVPRRKAPDKSVIPVNFRFEVPASGAVYTLWEPSHLSTIDPH